MREGYFEGTYYRTNEWKPDRPALLFAHGVSGSCSAWFPYEKTLGNKYNILTYDIRGHGMSTKFPNYSDYKIKNFADDLHKLVTHLGIQKFVLISNSFAALIALEYLKRWRKTVAANIFTSPEIYLHNGLRAKIFRLIVNIIAAIAALLPFDPKPRGHVDYRKHINSTDWNIKRNLADIRNTSLRAYSYTLKQSFTPNWEYSLEKISAPTLIVHGEKDTMVPIARARKMSEEIKNSEFISISNVDHNTAHNAVKEISEAIESFVEKNKDVCYTLDAATANI